MKLLIQNVRLETGYHYEDKFPTATKTEIKDILIEKGCFSHISEQIDPTGINTINANGQLILPSLREMHVHLDKTYFGGDWHAPVQASKGIFTRLEEESALLPAQLTTAADRAHYMIQHYIANGHTHIRTHINVDPHIKTKHIALIKEVLQQYKDQITYEIVAFPQHGLLRNGEAFLTVIEEALAMGVTHIGGVDPATMDHDISGVIKKTFELAEKYGVGIDIHLHDSDTLGAFEIHRIMDAMEARQYQAPVTISHAFAIAGIQGTDRDELVERMAKNKVTLTTTVAMGDSPITLPIDYLVRKGVQVELGHDSLIDHWSPFGTGDTIQKLNQVVRRFSWGDERRIGQVLKIASGGITTLSKKGEQLWPRVGDVANAILVDAVSSAHLIARQCPISIVISNGRIIHQADIKLKGAYRG